LTELSGPAFNFTLSGFVDPFRGNAVLHSVPVQAGPNPNLNPETGKSRTFGAVYSSKATPGLNISVNFWDLDITSYINRVGFQDLINRQDLFPGTVIRGPASPQDMQNGFSGPYHSYHL